MSDSGYIAVPPDVWLEVKGFFDSLVAPCKDCVRGNPVRCWNSGCRAFGFRSLARRIDALSPNTKVHMPRHVLVEDEILDILRRYGKPVYPSMVVLTTTNSKTVKSNAITRLAKQGRIVVEQVNEYTRKISLPTNQDTQNKES